MSKVVELTAEPRSATGKGPNRRLRVAGSVPAVIYGGGQDAEMVSLSAREVRKQLQTNPRFFSSLIELKLSDRSVRAVPREAQLHPVTDEALHIDFVRAGKGATVQVEIPVVFLNEETSVGLKRGGVLNVVRRQIEATCPAEQIPDRIELDLANVEIGDSVHISQVTLPEGVTPTITDRDFTICTIVGKGGGASADEAEAEGDEAEA